MKAFIGSSTDSFEDALLVATWIEEVPYDRTKTWEARTWRAPGQFPPSTYPLDRLIEISKEVDVAVLVFAEDETTWYREKSLPQTRDNVILEYGLFTSRLGPGRVVICRKGQPKTPSDLHGLTVIDLGKSNRAQFEIRKWLKNLPSTPPSAEDRKLWERIGSLEDRVAQLQSQATFEQEKAADLWEHIPKSVSKQDDDWTRLFEQAYFECVASVLEHRGADANAIRLLLVEAGVPEVQDRIAWKGKDSPGLDARNPQQRLRFARKVLRVFRQLKPSVYHQFLTGAPKELRSALGKCVPK